MLEMDKRPSQLRRRSLRCSLTTMAQVSWRRAADEEGEEAKREERRRI